MTGGDPVPHPEPHPAHRVAPDGYGAAPVPAQPLDHGGAAAQPAAASPVPYPGHSASTAAGSTFGLSAALIILVGLVALAIEGQLVLHTTSLDYIYNTYIVQRFRRDEGAFSLAAALLGTVGMWTVVFALTVAISARHPMPGTQRVGAGLVAASWLAGGVVWALILGGDGVPPESVRQWSPWLVLWGLDGLFLLVPALIGGALAGRALVGAAGGGVGVATLACLYWTADAGDLRQMLVQPMRVGVPWPLVVLPIALGGCAALLLRPRYIAGNAVGDPLVC